MMQAVRPLFAVLLLAVLVASLVVVTGCPKPQGADGVAPPPPPPPPAPAATEPAAPTSTFEWTETPKLADIPAGPLVGMVNGKPFEAKAARIEKKDDGFVLQIYDKAPDKPSGMVMDATGIELTFTTQLSEGKPGEIVLGIADKKDFDSIRCFYYYPQGGDKGPMSMNQPWGCAVKIDEWKMEKDPADDSVLGHVKGKVAIVFKDDAKSWVAGDLDGVYYDW
jgi:hypothetical protein